jgi:hypothetical protein
MMGSKTPLIFEANSPVDVYSVIVREYLTPDSIEV